MKLFYNAKFYSMKHENDFFAAVLVDNGIIKEIFNTIPELANVEKIDLQGSFVYPGFIDTHTHSFEGGLYSLGADLEKAVTLEDVFSILSETKPVSGKIFAFRFDERLVKEKRFPTVSELDKIFPDTPVILRRVDGHSCIINTKAAKSIDWDKSLPRNFNGYLSKRENGKAANWFHRNFDDESILKIYQKAANIALNKGHTTIHTMIGDGHSNIKYYKLIRNNLHQFSVEFILYPQITDVKKALEAGSPRIGGCILADGSFGSHTAALLEPYSDEPDNYGSLYRSSKSWNNLIQNAHKNNLQVAVHCIGDAAISQILTIYEKVQKDDPKDLRHAIIHNELTTEDILDREKNAKVSAIMQPMFDRLWANPGGLYETRLGKERILRTNRLASIYKRGILLTGGSDWYITEMNALKGIDAATRIHNKNERLSAYQAVEIYTKNAAELSFDENRLGTLEVSKQADFICLQNNIFTSTSIADIQIDAIIKKGCIKIHNENSIHE
jgi:predicted amidohydrolase YtcJ